MNHPDAEDLTRTLRGPRTLLEMCLDLRMAHNGSADPISEEDTAAALAYLNYRLATWKPSALPSGARFDECVRVLVLATIIEVQCRQTERARILGLPEIRSPITDAAIDTAVAEADPLAGLPEEERARIHTTARTEAIAAYNGGPEGGRSAAADGAYRAAVAREVAAYRAQNVPEMLDREEAEKRLLALDVRAIVGGRWADAEIEAWLSSPHESVRALEAAAVTGDKNPEVIRDRNEVLAILRAHVRWLDAQKSAAEHEPK